MDNAVAIVMTSYNSEKYIEAQLDSIINQSYKKWNLYISDDNSQDSTKIILENYSQKHSNIHYILNDINVGVGKNFERALSLINNETLVACCDSDDIWHPDKLELQVNSFNDRYILSHHDANLVNENLEPIGTSLWNQLSNGQVNDKDIINPTFESVLEKNSISGATSMFRSWLIPSMLPFPKGIVQDHWIALVSTLNGEVFSINKPLMDYRQHSDSLQGASVKKSKFYLSNIFSKSYNANYQSEIDNSYVMMKRLLKLSSSEAIYENINERIQQYKIVNDILCSNRLIKPSIIKQACSYLLSSRNKKYYKVIILFFLLSKTFEFKK